MIGVLTSVVCYAQDDHTLSPFSFSGYVETYYAYEFNRPLNNTRPAFVYSHNRHNEINLNLGFIKGSYNKDNVRANLAFMTGTYANANLASEPGVLKNIYEANAGVKISSSKKLWVDVGIFASHIGFESAVGKDCWSLTRSILADNTPYYESGAKISYTSGNGKWFLSALLLNGWQRIQRVGGNSLPSFGTQVTFKPRASITLNSSTFIGTDKPDSTRQMRYFHDLYGIFQVTEAFGLTVGFDYGAEQKSSETNAMNVWFSPVIIAKLVITEKVSVALRGEYYSDRHGVIITSATPNGFKTRGLSTNIDYRIFPNAVWRVEVRNFESKDKVFERRESPSKTDTFVTTALAVSF
ncbi:MAG: porin [Chryseolinea sp.]